MLRARLSNARFAVVVAAALALLGSGVAMGVTGAPVLLGVINNAGSAATRIEATSSGGAFWMRQHGTGSGVRADSDNGAGGVFQTKSANSYGLWAINSNTAAGNGFAIRADGNYDPALNLRVNSNSIAPMVVNSTHVVTNLNADLLDGQHATGFHQYNTSAPADSTQYGAFSFQGTAAAVGDFGSANISFPVPINSDLTVHLIQQGASVPSGCSGSPTAPGASPGNLCIFVGWTTNVDATSYHVYNPATGVAGASHYGAQVVMSSSASGTYGMSGTWAATAPLLIIILPKPTGAPTR